MHGLEIEWPNSCNLKLLAIDVCFGERLVQSLVHPTSKCVFIWFTMFVSNHCTINLFLDYVVLKGLKNLHLAITCPENL